MTQHLCVIGAMQEEIEGFLGILHGAEEVTPPSLDIPIVTGELNGQDIVLARCGIGKVNAALCTQFLIDHFAPKAIINTGVAGGISTEVDIGDLVISEEAVHHDFDARAFGYTKGVIPRLDTSRFAADPKLVDLAQQHADKFFNQVRCGLVVSGDQFISSPEQKRAIEADFPAALCAEMEGAAIAQAAYLNHIPFIILRAISDRADNSAPEDFDAYLRKIVPALVNVVAGMAEDL